MSIIRDAPLGQICRLILGPKSFPYPDEKEGFQFQVHDVEKAKSEPTSEQTFEAQETGSVKKNEGIDAAGSSTTDVEKGASPAPSSEDGYQTVGWYDDNDPENPLNWSTAKKTFTYFQICLLTFAGMFVYG
jgi:MFS transporter, DHA1 family, multidrug resistance protein